MVWPHDERDEAYGPQPSLPSLRRGLYEHYQNTISDPIVPLQRSNDQVPMNHTQEVLSAHNIPARQSPRSLESNGYYFAQQNRGHQKTSSKNRLYGLLVEKNVKFGAPPVHPLPSPPQRLQNKPMSMRPYQSSLRRRTSGNGSHPRPRSFDALPLPQSRPYGDHRPMSMSLPSANGGIRAVSNAVPSTPSPTAEETPVPEDLVWELIQCERKCAKYWSELLEIFNRRLNKASEELQVRTHSSAVYITISQISAFHEALVRSSERARNDNDTFIRVRQLLSSYLCLVCGT